MSATKSAHRNSPSTSRHSAWWERGDSKVGVKNTVTTWTAFLKRSSAIHRKQNGESEEEEEVSGEDTIHYLAYTKAYQWLERELNISGKLHHHYGGRKKKKKNSLQRVGTRKCEWPLSACTAKNKKAHLQSRDGKPYRLLKARTVNCYEGEVRVEKRLSGGHTRSKRKAFD